jgi:hypothetical protein
VLGLDPPEGVITASGERFAVKFGVDRIIVVVPPRWNRRWNPGEERRDPPEVLILRPEWFEPGPFSKSCHPRRINNDSIPIRLNVYIYMYI